METAAVDASGWIVPPSLATKFDGTTASFLDWWQTLRDVDDVLTEHVTDPRAALHAAYRSQGTEWHATRSSLNPHDELERHVVSESEQQARRLAASGLTVDEVAAFTGLPRRAWRRWRQTHRTSAVARCCWRPNRYRR